MSRVVACLVVSSASLFSFLGNKPVLLWSFASLREVRGISRIVCVVATEFASRANQLLAETTIDVVSIPSTVKASALEAWLTSAAGPACDAGVVLLNYGTSPLLSAAKIEACLRQVTSRKNSICYPARDVRVIVPGYAKRTIVKHTIDSVKVFRVTAPGEPVCPGTVGVNLTESLSVAITDEFFLVSAMVDGEHV